MSKLGAIGFKTYLQHPPLGREKEHARMHAFDDTQIESVFGTISKSGKPLVVHPEDDEVVSWLTSELIAQGRDDMSAFLSSRPEYAGLEAVKKCIRIALKHSGLRQVFAHVSCKSALDYLRNQKKSPLESFVERRPDYLLFQAEDATRLGPRLKTYSPVRSKRNQQAIIDSINDSTVDYFGSDHGPRTIKENEGADLWRISAGTPSIETTLRVLLNLVGRKLISLSSIVRMQKRAAEIFGLSPLRGSVEIGSRRISFSLISKPAKE